MLFETIVIILGIYVLVMPFLLLFAVKFGIKLSTKPQKTAEEPLFKIPKPQKKPKMDKDTQRVMDILGNIDTFDGTSKGQKEII